MSGDRPGMDRGGGVPVAAAAAAVLLALALAVSGGNLDPIALTMASAATLLALAGALLGRRHDTPGWSLVVDVLLGAGLLASLARHFVTIPRSTVLAALSSPFQLGVIAAAALLATWAWTGAPGWLRRARFPALVAVAVLLGILVIRTVPAPGIDVWQLQQGGVQDLLEGRNPYATPHPNHYGPGTPFIDRSLLTRDGAFITAFPYTPLNLLLDVASAFTGDVRYTMLAAMAVAAFLLRILGRRSRTAELAGALLLFQPEGFWVVQWAWTDPLALATVLLAACAVASGRGGWLWPGLAAGLAVSSKQYVVLLAIPLLLALPGRLRWRAVATATVVALAILAPFALWDGRALLRGVVEFQILQPFRLDALSWPAFVAYHGGPRLPSWPAFVAAALALLLTLRARVSVGQALLSGASAWLLFVILNKQAFCNYYWLGVGLLCGAVAAFSEPWAGSLPCAPPGFPPLGSRNSFDKVATDATLQRPPSRTRS